MEGECCSEPPPLPAAPQPVPTRKATAAAAAATTRNPNPGVGSGKERVYRGVRMRKWGKWVAEIREPNKRSRIWLGSYSTPVAAARAYDTAVYLLRGRSARLNFPEQISVEEIGYSLPDDMGCLSAASIRKKATEVGARVDALETTGLMSTTSILQHKTTTCHQTAVHHQKQQKAQQRTTKHPDLNQHPSPDTSDDDEFTV